MSAHADVIELRKSIVACVQTVTRILEWSELLRTRDLLWSEQLVLRMLQEHYLDQVHRLLSFLPADMTTEVLVACEKMSGVVMGFSLN
jgi:hypothetical protein